MNAENSRFLLTVVCDDVRQEIGNKISIMGVYDSSIVVGGFPSVVPRLCFVMKARTPIGQPFQHLKFLVWRDDEVIVEAEVPEENLAALTIPTVLPPDVPSGEPTDRAILATLVMVVSPIVFDKPCRLRFRAITESEELRGGTLVVTAANYGQALQ